MAALATFVGYQLSGHDFTPTKAFVTLSLLNMIRYIRLLLQRKMPYFVRRFPLAYLPVMIMSVSADMVAFGRIQKFLGVTEVSSPQPGPNFDKKILIR